MYDVATRSQIDISAFGSTCETLVQDYHHIIKSCTVSFIFIPIWRWPAGKAQQKQLSWFCLFGWSAGIPCKLKQHAISKSEAIFITWKNIQQIKQKRSELQEWQEQEFCLMVHVLFDSAHQDVFKIMTIHEDKDFLIAQREGHRGCMTSANEVTWKGRKIN